MKISAIVVTHNRLNLLKECLYHLLTQTYSINTIFVVNNNSTDGTKKYLHHLNNNKIYTINSKKNLGGAGGFSLGTKTAYQKSNADYLWLMDDDTMPTKSALDALIKASDKLEDNFGFLCSNVKWWKDHRPVNLPKVSEGDWTKCMPNSNVIKVDSATFVSFFVKSNVVKKVGLPISEMFIWGDDYEYSTRISRMFNSYFVPDSIIIHKSQNTNGKESISNTNRITNYNYKYRNDLFTVKKYYGFKKIMKNILYDLSICFEALFFSKNKKIQRSFCVLSGVIKGIFFNPIIYYPNKNNNHK